MRRGRVAELTPKLGEAEARLRELIEQAGALVDTAEERARQQLLKITDEDFARAATRREFVKEDAQTLPASELLKGPRAAIEGNDRATMWLYARYGKGRMSPEQLMAMPEADRFKEHELQAAVSQVEQALTDPDVEQLTERANRLRGKASELRRSLPGYAQTLADRAGLEMPAGFSLR